NPNNPDGRLVRADDLAAVAREMAARKRLLVVDEAFADVLPAAASLVPRAAQCGAVVLRSFGKTYGLAGVRLGFLVAPPPFAQAVRDALGPWAVSGPALAAGRLALADRAWLDATIERLDADAARLDGMLSEWGMTPAGGTPLFRLASAPDAQERFRRLAASGVLVRAFAGRPDWLRFGLPAPGQWALLGARLKTR
ncbi:aminotransferase class I/II-fold pyridoxal phosphate-dependent enzyme, partial [Nostoc sp. NIES-2111]